MPHEPQAPGVDLLDGVRVVDFSHVHAGPLCAYQLALMGADVVKVESPAGGDQMRAGHPQGLPPVFLGQNANKRSLAELDGVPGAADGNLRFIGTGFTVDAAPATPQRPPPRLGEHGAEILAELGYDDAAIAELRTQGVLA